MRKFSSADSLQIWKVEGWREEGAERAVVFIAADLDDARGAREGEEPNEAAGSGGELGKRWMEVEDRTRGVELVFGGWLEGVYEG
ncbi:hypothetical protein K432DRAFT_100018 [Lepidopterella palustris CBS 459.81]|uniref:Uncharacterized protein n=1 Tax=Lepidopterella palustris CBS 459.81 TaxID=1314670 RepID=A0A8E2E6C2_9PEZI|nr:hypothetical protein K432DRAFT_100018 [Lepidopterella palustris CBS 459.81]